MRIQEERAGKSHPSEIVEEVQSSSIALTDAERARGSKEREVVIGGSTISRLKLLGKMMGIEGEGRLGEVIDFSSRLMFDVASAQLGGESVAYLRIGDQIVRVTEGRIEDVPDDDRQSVESLIPEGNEQRAADAIYDFFYVPKTK